MARLKLLLLTLVITAGFLFMLPPTSRVEAQGGCVDPNCPFGYIDAGGVCQSPIIVDLDGKGISLTSAANGVLFDMQGNGQPIQIAWTVPEAANAFLALDRNGNGRIDNGTELFGNFTTQPESNQKNGFAALAEYDKPENGGNGDGVIDE